MPGRNGTGPNGQGPLTGGAMGYCAGNSVETNKDSLDCRGSFGFRRGWGRGWFCRGVSRGWGRGRVWLGYGGAWGGDGLGTTVHDEVKMLKEDAEFLNLRLREIQDHIEKLEKK
ncbi:MAG: DUF5320 domain-containing protein [bacterium]